MASKMIVVLGPTGVGKSSFIRDAIPQGDSNSVQVGHGLQSETSCVQAVQYETQNVKLVDTPGFDDSRSDLTDVDVLQMIAEFLTTEWQTRTSELVGLIYIYRISDTRVGATSRRNLRMFQKLCGQDAMKNVVIVTTMWDKVTSDEGLRREQELKEKDSLFKPLVACGAEMMRHERTAKSATKVISYLLKKNPTTTQIVREIAEEKKALVDTEAGAELQDEIRALLKRHKEEMQQMEEEIKNATQGDTAALKEIKEEKRKLEDKLKQELEKLRRSFWDRRTTMKIIFEKLLLKKTWKFLHLVSEVRSPQEPQHP